MCARLAWQACDVPFDPVYLEEDGMFAPGLAYDEKRADWQAWIDKTVYKQE